MQGKRKTTSKRKTTTKKATAKKTPARKTTKPSTRKTTPKRTASKHSTTTLKKALPGADDVYLTDTKIAVRNISQYSNGKYVDKTRYFPKTSENLKTAREFYGYIKKGR